MTSMTIVEIFGQIPITVEIRQCGHKLLNGSCVHVTRAPVIEYDYCRIPNCDCAYGYGLAQTHRHSHTWQMGDARYLDIDDKVINMETGEVVGRCDFGTDQIIERIKAEKIANDPRRILTMYGFDLPASFVRTHPLPTNGYDWYYEGKTTAIGLDAEGHNVEFSFETGSISRIYSQNEKRRAVTMARNQGPTVAARTTGVPVETVRTWSKRSK